MTPDAEVHWRLLHGDDDEGWRWTRVLYAYLHPRRSEILYVGKTDGVTSTVRSRWRAADKLGGFWDEIERRRRIFDHRVLVGEIALLPGSRLSRQLLADIEGLLIFHAQPWGNIQSSDTLPPRPGLVVRCRGRAWPGRSLFSC